MALPITVPYTFGNATTAIPLSNLDSDYATVYQAVNGIGNGSVALANVAITGGTISGNTTASNVTVSSGTFTNVTLSNVTISSVSTPITAAEGGTGSSSAFTSGGVVYASSTSALATGSALTFDGTNFSISNGYANIFKYIGFNAGGTQAYIGRASDLVTGGWAANDVAVQTAGNFLVATGGAASTLTLTTAGNLGLGVTPSTWSTGRAVEVGFVGSSIFGRAANTTDYTQGVYYNAGFKYAQATYAVSLYEQQSGAHYWLIAGSGSVGSAVSFTQAMTLTAGSTLLVGYTSGNEVTKIETPSISIGQTGTTSTTAKIRFAPAQAGYNVMGIYNSQSASGGGLVFVTGDSTTNSSNAALMTLDASGNLLVGTTSQPGAGLSTTGNEFISAGGFISCRNSAAGYTGYVTNTSGAGLIQFFANTTAVGSISTSGGVTLYNTTSDQRLKTNIVDAPEFGSIIDSIQVRSYDWKNNQIHQRAGFIAQELVTVAPEAVHQPADTEEMMAVDYSKLVPMLVKEIQSLRKRILTLENK